MCPNGNKKIQQKYKNLKKQKKMGERHPIIQSKREKLPTIGLDATYQNPCPSKSHS